MGLLDGFEKLINEHGSATILKERIALANDKYAALEQKLVASELRANNLESENQRLNVYLEKAKVEIQNLEKLTEQSHGSRLEEVKENLLKLLAEHPDVEAEQIANALEANAQLITFHLTELENSRFVNGSYSVYDKTTWSIAHDGRGYLVKHGLLA